MKRNVAFAGVLPMLLAGGALFWLSVRPCEPVAQASQTPVESPVLQMPEHTIVADPVIRTVSVNDLPRVRQGSAKRVAPPVGSHWTPPPRICGWYPLEQGTIGTHVWSCNEQTPGQ